MHHPVASILLAILLAALAYYLCLALGLPAVVGLIAAVLTLIAAASTTGWRL